ncbi:uncharacterized protein LOC124374185 [Homalodisca vitripennis]|uniref:uncharacterized protein LOC124374185 n=1 Tax=Homalodisca vitripennis TaxID=197043 RepID=UPI001EEB0650|nr:uncharacterized protein LOC124374185 [Homalodisca vitripennis]
MWSRCFSYSQVLGWHPVLPTLSTWALRACGTIAITGSMCRTAVAVRICSLSCETHRVGNTCCLVSHGSGKRSPEIMDLDQKDTILLEKHLDMPASWVQRLHIPH